MFDPSSAEEEEEEEDAEAAMGYEPIRQEEGEEGEEEEEEGEELSMEEQVAALVRAGQMEQENLSRSTREAVEQAEEERRAEEVRERVEVWGAGVREESIAMDEEKVATIKSFHLLLLLLLLHLSLLQVATIKALMAGVKLPQVPDWATSGEEGWRERIKK